MIYYTSFKTVFGILGLIRNKKGLQKIYLPNEILSENNLHKQYPNQELIIDNSKFMHEIKQLNEYFNGDRTSFELDMDLNVSPFYKKVLMEVSKVPYGKTASYSDIARRVNNSKAVRAVGSANARNPIPIIIPCHRIITKSGMLGGYRGGLPMKEKLLKFESNILNTN
jgi:O-6-methylguanine DNA methyltransferase